MGTTHIVSIEVPPVDDLKPFLKELRADSRRAGREQDLEAYLRHFQFARQVQELRAAKGLSQSALALRARVPQSEISRLETGRGNPTLTTLTRIADACGARLVLAPARRQTRRSIARVSAGARAAKKRAGG